MVMININKDLLTASNCIIAHQVNCQGIMDKGLAFKIKSKYPVVFSVYETQVVHYSTYKNTEELLGTIQVVNVDDISDTYVANLFGQNKFGYKGTKYTDEEAIKECLIKLDAFAINLDKDIYVPYLMSCDRAGGDWEYISSILDSLQSKVYVCKN